MVVELGNEKIPVAGMGGYTDDTSVVMGNRDVLLPSKEAEEEMMAELL
jgi:hypothetical protein